MYTQYCDELPSPLSIPEFWEGMKGRFLNPSTIAADAIWMPVASVDVEHSFLQYKYIYSMTEGRV